MEDTLQQMDPEVREELTEIVEEMLDGIAEASLHHAPLPNVARHADTAVEATLEVLGASQPSRLTVRVSADDALALAAVMLEEPVADLELEDAVGTVAEMCNVLAGSAKSLLEAETALNVPSAVARPIADLGPLPSVEVHHELGTFHVHFGA